MRTPPTRLETAYLADRKKTALFNAELFIGYQSPFIERQYANFFPNYSVLQMNR